MSELLKRVETCYHETLTRLREDDSFECIELVAHLLYLCEKLYKEERIMYLGEGGENTEEKSDTQFVNAILQAEVKGYFNLSQLFSYVISFEHFEKHGPTYTILHALSSSRDIYMYNDSSAQTGPISYINQEQICVSGTMNEVGRHLTSHFLYNVVRPLVGKNFDRMFAISAIAFSLDELRMP